MNNNTDNKTSMVSMVIGCVVVAVGLATAACGTTMWAKSKLYYLILEAIGAALLVGGITPVARWLQAWREERARNQNSLHIGGDDSPFGGDGLFGGGGLFGEGGLFGSGEGDDQSGTPFDKLRDALHKGHTPGQTLDAEIIGITQNTRVRASDPVEYYVICKAGNQTFTSQALSAYPGEDMIGRHVNVVFHSWTPDDYTVDLHSVH